jgi:transposase
MRKLTVRDPDSMRLGIIDEIQRNEDSRYDHRLHGILLICNGMSCYQVATLLGQAPRTVQYWVRRFESHGFAGLQEKPRQGRPAALDDAALTKVEKDLRQNPRSLGYSQNFWDGKLLSHHLTVTYGVIMGVRQCQRLFKRLGFRLRKPRPVIAKRDPEAQQAYKKTSASGCQSQD